jgi:hypothetical protein
MTRVLLIGDSHLGAIKRGQRLEPSRSTWLSFENLGKGRVAKTRFFEVYEAAGCVRITADEWNKLEFFGAGRTERPVPDLLVVSLPLNTSRILREFSWDTHVPWRLKLKDGEIALSDAFVDGLIDQDSRNAVDFVFALSDIGLSVAVLEAPRFFEDAGFLKTCRLDVIGYIDKAYRQRVGQTLESKGISVIPQAPHTISDLGSTKMDFDNERPEDAHHGNATYGTIAIEQIQTYASGRLGRAVD